MNYPKPIQLIISHFQKISGVGKKTAERYAFQMISWQDTDIQKFTEVLRDLKESLYTCDTCGSLSDLETCKYCDPTRRDATHLCIISSPKDLFTIEATHSYNGMYHVLSHNLSPLEDTGPNEEELKNLKKRIQETGVKEVILALDSTIEGDATALYLKKDLSEHPVIITRLALGMPLGSTLEFLDEGTLSRALSTRTPI